MKKHISIGVLLLIIAGSFSTGAHAFALWSTGTPTIVYSDPSDVVVGLNVAGPCGSSLYHIQRAKLNFSVFQDLVKQAFLWNKKLDFLVTSCAGDRNILSHGAMHN